MHGKNNSKKIDRNIITLLFALNKRQRGLWGHFSVLIKIELDPWFPTFLVFCIYWGFRAL